MARSTPSLAFLTLSLSVTLAGCPGPETMPPGVDAGPGVDGGPRDAPVVMLDTPGLDAPGLDAPGLDAPIVMTDTPVVMTDAPMTTGCELTGYPALAQTTFISGLSSPVFMTQAPGSTDFFVVERGGRIRIADSAGVLVATPFIDLRPAIEAGGSPPTGGDEQGLLGLAFHPDYVANGLFYVTYTPNTGGAGNNYVAVGRRSAGDPRRADATVTPILTIPDPYWNHNGGGILFGPDGELYVGTGDGGSGGDPMGNGQDETQLLGKLLRIHVDATTGTSYTIPAGNTFTAPNRPEIWATGLRNPWRFSFDRLTGDLWIGDVGQNAWEEVDVALAGTGGGENYGWSACEGLRNFTGGGACSLTGHHAPIVVQSHGADPVVGSAISVTGGYVYRGSAIPGLRGAYVFGDYGGWIAALRYCSGTVRDYQILADITDTCPNGPVSFAEDAAGEIYMVCFGASASGGSVRRIIPG